VGVHVLFLGIGPFLWIPFGKTYGRRPVLLCSMLISCIANIGGGFAKSYGTLMAARVFQSIAISSGYVIGSAVVVDIFSSEERGKKTGVWTFMVTIGPGLGALIGAFLINAEGWQWSLWLCAIINGAELIGYFFTFKETLWPDQKEKPALLVARIFPWPISGKRLRGRDFFEPLLLFQSPVVLICAMAYSVSFAVASVGLLTIEPIAFERFYGFGTTQDGLVLLSVLIGAIIGEQAAGPLSDLVMKRHAVVRARKGKEIRLEHRLVAALSGYVLLPVGLIIYGVTLEKYGDIFFLIAF
jgi:multidrug resistance protein